LVLAIDQIAVAMKNVGHAEPFMLDAAESRRDAF
jgi:hypothetical protein